MGQVWPSANFGGTSFAGNKGGRGSVLAVTAQNPGPDGVWGTSDDVLAPLNRVPVDISIDFTSGPVCDDARDRVRNFLSLHASGANFLAGDGSVHFVGDSIDDAVYRGLSTINGAEESVEF